MTFLKCIFWIDINLLIVRNVKIVLLNILFKSIFKIKYSKRSAVIVWPRHPVLLLVRRKSVASTINNILDWINKSKTRSHTFTICHSPDEFYVIIFNVSVDKKLARRSRSLNFFCQLIIIIKLSVNRSIIKKHDSMNVSVLPWPIKIFPVKNISQKKKSLVY